MITLQRKADWNSVQNRIASTASAAPGWFAQMRANDGKEEGWPVAAWALVGVGSENEPRVAGVIANGAKGLELADSFADFVGYYFSSPPT